MNSIQTFSGLSELLYSPRLRKFPSVLMRRSPATTYEYMVDFFVASPVLECQVQRCKSGLWNQDPDMLIDPCPSLSLAYNYRRVVKLLKYSTGCRANCPHKCSFKSMNLGSSSILRRARIFQSTSWFTKSNALRRST